MKIPVTGATLAAATLLAACASSGPRPDAPIARAEASLVQAEQAGARQYAGTEYDKARDKVAEAHRLADKKKNQEAAMLADEARVDAELAAARSRHQVADNAAEEVRAATATLQEEISRQRATSTSDAPGAGPGAATAPDTRLAPDTSTAPGAGTANPARP